MPSYWEPGEPPGLGITLPGLRNYLTASRMTRTAQTALARGATMDQARAHAIATEQARPAGVTTVRSRIIGGVQTVPGGPVPGAPTGGSVFSRARRRAQARARAAAAAAATPPRVSPITSSVPPGPGLPTTCPPGHYMMSPGTRSQRCVPMVAPKVSKVEAINGIRAAEARPSVPPPGPLQQPADTYGTALIREGLEKMFGPRQMQQATPQAPPGTMPGVEQAAQAAGVDTEAAKKILPIAAAALLAWKLLF